MELTVFCNKLVPPQYTAVKQNHECLRKITLSRMFTQSWHEGVGGGGWSEIVFWMQYLREWQHNYIE